MSISNVSFKSRNAQIQGQEQVKSPQKVELQTTNDQVEISSKKKKTARSFFGSIGAYLVGSLVLGTQSLFAVPLMKKVPDLVSFSGEEASAIEKALKDTVADSGLKEKGVRIRYLNPLRSRNLFGNKSESAAKQLMERLSKTDKPLREFWSAMNLDMIRKGSNAAFTPEDIKLTKVGLKEFIEATVSNDKEAIKAMNKNTGVFIKANSVLAPQGKLQGSIFHELGHAMNANFSKFGKFLQKCRPAAMFAPGLLITYGAFTRKSKPRQEGQELNGAQKTHNFIRNNAGKLAFISSLPILIEEMMATVKGQKYAKKFLKPEMAKKVLKGNLLPYITYIALAALATLGAKTAVSIKDNAIEKKEEKLQLRAERKALKAQENAQKAMS